MSEMPETPEMSEMPEMPETVTKEQSNIETIFDDDLDEDDNVTHTDDKEKEKEKETGYEPVNPLSDKILPANMGTEDAQRLELLKQMSKNNPEMLQKFLMNAMMQQQMQDPEQKRELLKRRLHEKMAGHRYTRVNKKGKQKMEEVYEQKQAELKKAQDGIINASKGTDKVGENNYKNSDIDNLAEDLDNLPSVNTMNLEPKTPTETSTNKSTNTVKTVRQGAVKKAGRRRGMRKKKGKK
jgi:hypothetical protein